MKLKVVTDINQISIEKWSSFVDKHPKGTFFHTYDFYEAFQSLQNLSSHIIILTDSDLNILALSVFVIFEESGLKSYLSRRAISMGPILSVDDNPELKNKLLSEINIYLKGKVIYFELRNVAAADFSERYSSFGYNVRKHVNIKLNLNVSEQNLFDSFTSSARNKIRRAEQNELIFKELDAETDLSELFDLMSSVYQRIKLPFFSKDDFYSIVKTINSKGKLWIAGVYNKTRLVSSMILTQNKDELYSWYLATSRNPKEVGATDFLVWNILKLAKEKNIGVYNWGGAGYPSTPYGVRDFKSKFSGDTYEDVRLVKVYKPIIYCLGQFYIKYLK